MLKLVDAELLKRCESNQEQGQSLYARGRLFSALVTADENRHLPTEIATPADDYRHNHNTIYQNIPPTTISPSKDGSIDSCPPKGKRFVKPTVEEVHAYCLERSNGIDAQAFIDFYESKGWLIGKNPMKDWKAAVRTWEQRHKEDLKRYGTKQRNSKFADPEESARAMLAGLNAAVTERDFAQNIFGDSAPY